MAAFPEIALPRNAWPLQSQLLSAQNAPTPVSGLQNRRTGEREGKCLLPFSLSPVNDRRQPATGACGTVQESCQATFQEPWEQQRVFPALMRRAYPALSSEVEGLRCISRHVERACVARASFPPSRARVEKRLAIAPPDPIGFGDARNVARVDVRRQGGLREPGDIQDFMTVRSRSDFRRIKRRA